MEARLLDHYADLVLQIGINLQAGEGLVLTGSTAALPLARAITAKAYQMGARDVVFFLRDGELERLRFAHGGDEVFTYYPAYRAEQFIQFYEDGYSHAFLLADDPQLLATVDPTRIALQQKTTSTVAQKTGLMQYRMTGKTRWTIAAMPQADWARLVFPDQSPKAALDGLGQAIAASVRLDQENPVQAWRAHLDRLARIHSALNAANLDRLHFVGPGTDLTVGLADGHKWVGGAKNSTAGVPFVANLPTEEVFSTPHAKRVDGVVRSTKPLSLNGNLIDDFSFTFKEGAVVDFQAAQGQRILADLLEQDAGARRLGEVALVAERSPIAESGILFYNTLFDENASCHFALGQSYAFAMREDGSSEEERAAWGANRSIVHVDFMVGSPELTVTGYTKAGQALPILERGNFVAAIEGG